MKKLIEKINKNSLLSGIIGTILFIYFLQPILEFVGNLLISFYRLFSQNLYNRIFEEMALGKPDYSFTLILLLNGLFLGIILSVFIKTLFPKKLTNDDSETEKNTTDFEHIQEIQKKNKKQSLFRKIISGVLFAFMLSIMSISYIKHSNIQSFDQRIRIISPYISAPDKDKLISDFSRMKTYDDYEKIMNELQLIAKKNNIQLPNTITHWF